MEVRFSWQAQGIVRLRGVMEVTFRYGKFLARGIVRLQVVVEVNVAVTLGLACERALFGGAGIAKLLA